MRKTEAKWLKTKRETRKVYLARLKRTACSLSGDYIANIVKQLLLNVRMALSAPMLTQLLRSSTQMAASLLQKDLAAALRNILESPPWFCLLMSYLALPKSSANLPLGRPLDCNILKEKRFLFWDDFRRVEYGQKTVPVATFLSLFQGQPFEVQVSQSFNDGNVDFEWHHGCVLTAKAEGLWLPRPGVDGEDIRHMQSRLWQFNCVATVQHLKDTIPCARCMCCWIRDGAATFDAAQVLRTVPVATPQKETTLAGMDDLVEKAHLSRAIADALVAEIATLGAVDVKELLVSDWKALTAFNALLPFEQRRLLSVVQLHLT
ncbi:Uncharacterized protein SCF082_LOCUS16872 [Durusdinium trenchii]|uniref:Uncharacterized protein n=1 Tax=Durusdinium trenchii TaxID=1381693 RepID=A0ABP0KDX0_9DINO